MDRDGQEYLAATKLASLGFCEVKILKERVHGRRSTREQSAAAERGEREHQRFHQVVVEAHNRPTPSTDRRCFIATAVYGIDDPRTDQLRSWRDRRLHVTWFGRLVVRAYYALSPTVVSVLVRWPRLQSPVRKMLDVIRQGLASKE